MSPPCEQLDDYLLGELTPAEQQNYEEHLEECPDCRTAMAQQQLIDRLVKSTIESIPIPDTILTASRRAEPSLQRSRAGMAIVIVALLVIAVTGWGFRPKQPPIEVVQDAPSEAETVTLPKSSPQKPVEPAPMPPEPESVANHDPPAKVRVDFPENVIAVPIETGHDDITIIQVFPVSEISLNP